MTITWIFPQQEVDFVVFVALQFDSQQNIVRKKKTYPSMVQWNFVSWDQISCLTGLLVCHQTGWTGVELTSVVKHFCKTTCWLLLCPRMPYVRYRTSASQVPPWLNRDLRTLALRQDVNQVPPQSPLQRPAVLPSCYPDVQTSTDRSKQPQAPPPKNCPATDCFSRGQVTSTTPRTGNNNIESREI